MQVLIQKQLLISRSWTHGKQRGLWWGSTLSEFPKQSASPSCFAATFSSGFSSLRSGSPVPVSKSIFPKVYSICFLGNKILKQISSPLLSEKIICFIRYYNAKIMRFTIWDDWGTYSRHTSSETTAQFTLRN